MPLLCYRSFTFTVNNIPGGHLLVMAVVMPVRLELSSNQLVLKPHGFLLQTYFRGTVKLSNYQNYLVRFQWMPVNTERGISFSMCPAQGNNCFYLFDLDIHLFMYSGINHLVCVCSIMVLRT